MTSPANTPLTKFRTTPPKPRLAFRVGVVGHRLDRLQQADLTKLGDVLQEILTIAKGEVDAMKQRAAWLFDDAAPKYQAASPLAEGTDRIFAERALRLGFELCCIMPFHQAEYEQDFHKNGTVDEFRNLLAKATTRFELDGTHANSSASYGAAGRAVLNQSDLLVVVWDGERLNKRGGTEEIFDEARLRGIGVVWVDAHAPHLWQVVDAKTDLSSGSTGRLVPSPDNQTARFRELLQDALDLPEVAPGEQGSAHSKSDTPEEWLRKYYAETQRRRNLAVFWKIFRDIVGDWTFPKVQCRVDDYERSVITDWPLYQEPTNAVEIQKAPVAKHVDTLRPFYAWPDKLAVIYSDRYRSAFVLAFLFAAIAVGCALLPGALETHSHNLETLITLVEFLIIITILGVVLVGTTAGWHERWISYRLAAELVRHLRLVAPLAGGCPLPQVPAHWKAYGLPSLTWMAWYVRAVERSLGLPTAVVNPLYLNQALNHLETLVDRQIDFHETSTHRSHRIEKSLHVTGITFLILTLIACGLHLLPGVAPIPCLQKLHGFSHWLTFCCGFFPALGATMAGILNQGEFRRVAMRSKAMKDQLSQFKKDIGELRKKINAALSPATEQFSIRATELTSNVARLLLNEVLDWRVVFLDRPVVPPS